MRYSLYFFQIMWGEIYVKCKGVGKWKYPKVLLNFCSATECPNLYKYVYTVSHFFIYSIKQNQIWLGRMKIIHEFKNCSCWLITLFLIICTRTILSTINAGLLKGSSPSSWLLMFPVSAKTIGSLYKRFLANFFRENKLLQRLKSLLPDPGVWVEHRSWPPYHGGSLKTLYVSRSVFGRCSTDF